MSDKLCVITCNCKVNRKTLSLIFASAFKIQTVNPETVCNIHEGLMMVINLVRIYKELQSKASSPDFIYSASKYKTAQDFVKYAYLGSYTAVFCFIK